MSEEQVDTLELLSCQHESQMVHSWLLSNSFRPLLSTLNLITFKLMTKYTLDAENKRIGRVATLAAVYLMGKNLAVYTKNKIPDITVEIKNTSKALVDDNKKAQKTYSRYSGYPGGLKQPTMEQVIAKKGYSEIFKNAVSGMLPKNKLRQKMMNNLILSE
ncbi:MAG: hypothetical protein EXS47_00135 [Candidatus Zambryskibacteria bacterium]|nr:hypothetical protein [Candidatus Zambryskibacteria bacterium]